MSKNITFEKLLAFEQTLSHVLKCSEHRTVYMHIATQIFELCFV